MPYIGGIGLHIIVAIFFAIHAVRTGQSLFWLIILFSFPLLGSLVYFVVVYLPDSGIKNGAQKVMKTAAKVMDPSRELREARAAFEFTPTAQNQMRLAAALLQAGEAAEAAQHYERCLTGPFASDAEIRLGAARALIESQQYDKALMHLDTLLALNGSTRGEQIALLRARALEGAGRKTEAGEAYAQAYAQFGSFETQAEYAIWCFNAGDLENAQRLSAEIDIAAKRWSNHTRELNRALMRRLDAARDNAGKR